MLKKVLIVDDEEFILNVVSGFLETAGYTPYRASSGETALEIAIKEKIHIIITDLKMSGMNGMNLMKEIKKRSPLSEVIILTGFSDLELVLTSLKGGAIDFIRKPFNMKDILDSVKKAEIKIQDALLLKNNLEEIKNQNFELVTYKALLEKRAGELFVKQEELSNAYKIIDEQNKNLQKKVDKQVREIIKKESAASYGELIQGITHNMNTPLSTINGGIDILKSRLLRDKERGEINIDSYINAISRVSGATKNLIQIVKNTMKRSRDENRAEKIDLNINKLLTQELEFLQANMFFKHQVKKEFDFSEEIPTIKAIYSDLSQIFLNIIQNSIDAMWETKEKVMKIKTRLKDDKILVNISDSGCGIPEKNLKKIFNIFFTTKPTEEGKDNHPVGNGLGLHMVSQLANIYGIKIDVKSKINEGTSFSIEIPITENQ